MDNFLGLNTGGRSFFVKNFGRSNNRQLTQELRIASAQGKPLEYILGLYYYKRDLFRSIPQYLDVGVVSGLPERVFGLSRYLETDVQNESIAAFASMTMNAGPDFRVTGGMRIQRDSANLDVVNSHSQTGTFLTELPYGIVGQLTTSGTDTGFSWKLSAEYDVNDDVMTYVSLGRGYKAPGVNSSETALAAPRPIIAAEVPVGYEFGIKSELFDRRLRLNTALFYTKFRNFQAEAAVVDNLGVTSFYLATAGVLVSKGFEVTLNAKPARYFSLDAALSYIDAKYERFDGAACYTGQTTAQGCVNGAQDLSGARPC